MKTLAFTDEDGDSVELSNSYDGHNPDAAVTVMVTESDGYTVVAYLSAANARRAAEYLLKAARRAGEA